MFWRCLMIDSSYLSKLSFTVIWAWYFLQGCAARNVHGFTQEDIEKMSKQWEEASSLYLQLDVKVCCKFGVIWLKVLAWSSHNNSSANCIIMSSYWCLHCFSFTYLTVIISWRWSKGKQNTGGSTFKQSTWYKKEHWPPHWSNSLISIIFNSRRNTRID